MSKRIFDALKWASELHRLQRRKGAPEPVPGKCPRGTPYINHVIAVADLLVNVGGIEDEDILIAAILHDVVEDTEVTLEDVSVRMGPVVAEIVGEVSDDRSLTREERKENQVIHAPTLSFGARLVKLADKSHNCLDLAVNPPVAWSRQRVLNYFEWSFRVVEGLRGTNAPLERLFDEVFDNSKALVESIEG
jgi:guanosine-3',5'-bis(diphosphate) 3'-pyrophosphohydrolase